MSKPIDLSELGEEDIVSAAIELARAIVERREPDAFASALDEATLGSHLLASHVYGRLVDARDAELIRLVGEQLQRDPKAYDAAELLAEGSSSFIDPVQERANRIIRAIRAIAESDHAAAERARQLLKEIKYEQLLTQLREGTPSSDVLQEALEAVSTLKIAQSRGMNGAAEHLDALCAAAAPLRAALDVACVDDEKKLCGRARILARELVTRIEVIGGRAPQR